MDWEWIHMRKRVDLRRLLCTAEVNLQWHCWDLLLQPSVGTKGGIILTKGVCSVCYFDKNIVDKVELLTRPEIVGKSLLPLCRNCFDVNIKCPTKMWHGNTQKNREKKKQSKKRHMETLVTKVKQKGRKWTWICWNRIWQGPAQDFPYDLILCYYVSKNIYLS